MSSLKQYRKGIINLFLGIVGIVLIILMVKFSGVSLRMIIDSIHDIKYYYFIAVVIATSLIVVFTSWKWQTILHGLTEIKKITRGYFLYYSALGLVSNNIIPHLGNYGLKTASMKLLYDVPISNGVLSILVEQLFDLLILILLSIPALLFFLKILSLKMSVIFVVVFFLLSFSLLIYNYSMLFGGIVKCYRFLYKIASKFFLVKNKTHSNCIVSGKIEPGNKITAIKLFLYACFKQIFVVLRIYIVMVALHIDVPFFSIVLGAALVQGIILIGLIPGSLGTLEAGWFGVLALLGIAKSDIGVFIVVMRILGEVSLVFVTFISYLYYIFNKMLLKPKLAKTS